MSDSVWQEILKTIGVLVLQRRPDDVFQLEGIRPAWYERLFDDPEEPGEVVDVAARFPFMDSFLPTATNFLNTKTHGRIRSGIWVEGSEGEFVAPLQASAVCLDVGSKLLLIENVKSQHDREKGYLQTARTGSLEQDEVWALQSAVKGARQRADGLMRALEEMVLRVGRDGRVLECHPASFQILQAPFEGEMRTLDRLMPPGVAEELQTHGDQAIASGKVQEFRLTACLPAGDATLRGRVSPAGEGEFWALLRPEGRAP